MVIAIYVALAWLGLAFGSFVNALVWRLHKQSSKPKAKSLKLKAKANSYSIWNGRSACPNCRHKLAWYDLIPILSWLALRGRCRYCKKPISAQYPLVEIALALTFTLSYAFWPVAITSWQWVLFITWLVSSIGLLALLVYDARFMLLPNKIIYPTLLVAVTGRLIYLIGHEPNKGHVMLLWLTSLLAASGLFWVLYMVSAGKWIGYGDVRLGLITGTLLASPAKSFLMIFLASVLGVLFIIPALAAGKKTMASRLPYGPFLIAATGLSVLFGSQIIDWYKRVFLP